MASSEAEGDHTKEDVEMDGKRRMRETGSGPKDKRS